MHSIYQPLRHISIHKNAVWVSQCRECVQQTGKEVATFLGFAGYYRTFIPKYSALTNQLNRVKKAKKFMWNEEIERVFIELKKVFTKGEIQAFPDLGVGDLFILTTD